MTHKNRKRLVVICGESDFDILNDVLYQYIPDVLEGMTTHFGAEFEEGLSVFIPHEWPEGKLNTLSFFSLD